VDVNTLGGHGNIAPMMRKEAAEAEAEMTAAAAEDGIYLQFSSAYRSEEYQSELYWGYVASDGQEAADTYSSRPGYSDHQTGLAADFVENGSSDFTAGFENTESGKWLYEHAWEYGFVIRYPKGKDEITGYTYEPWHYRYIGKDWAAKLHAVSPDETIEEYFGVSGGTEYTDPISTPAS
jgi:LAS superfamily LD-carboxypeptidase LdcB